MCVALTDGGVINVGPTPMCHVFTSLFRYKLTHGSRGSGCQWGSGFNIIFTVSEHRPAKGPQTIWNKTSTGQDLGVAQTSTPSHLSFFFKSVHNKSIVRKYSLDGNGQLWWHRSWTDGWSACTGPSMFQPSTTVMRCWIHPRWFRHLIRMVFHTGPTWRRPWDRPRTLWKDWVVYPFWHGNALRSPRRS